MIWPILSTCAAVVLIAAIWWPLHKTAGSARVPLDGKQLSDGEEREFAAALRAYADHAGTACVAWREAVAEERAREELR